MKVFYIPGAYDGCYYYRGYMPGTYTDQLVSQDFVSNTFNTKKMFDMAMQADVCVIQRPNEPFRYELAKLLKQKGKKIIFENDDTYLPDKGVPLSMLANDKQREIAIQMNDYLYKTIAIADGVIASTETLADEYRKVHNNVRVVKNCIDPLDEVEKEVNDTGKFRVGFIGSVVSNDDYTHIKNQIRALADRGDITIVVFGMHPDTIALTGGYKDDYAFWSSLPNVEWQHFVPIFNYYHTIASLKLDLAIIPRKESYFNQCKSNLKFLEMSLLKIPVLAQGFSDGTSPYQGKDKKYMTIVTDNTKWYDTVVHIKDNYTQFAKLANKAYDYVIKDYNINTYAKVWDKTIKELCF